MCVCVSLCVRIFRVDCEFFLHCVISIPIFFIQKFDISADHMISEDERPVPDYYSFLG